MVKKKFEFDFALSFAGAQRDIARALYNALKKKGLKVFFDEQFNHILLGKNATDYFREVYGEKSHYCVVLISKEYDEGLWPKIEHEIIEARQLESGHDILLPVLTDDYKPKWLHANRIYFDLKTRSLEELVEILKKKARPP